MPTRKIVVTSSQIVQDTYNPATPNEVICCKCQEVLFTAQNIHNTLLRLNDIDGLTGSGLNYGGTLLEINGIPPTYPVYLSPGETFTFLVKICYNNTGLDGYIKFRFSTNEHGFDDFYYLPLTCANLESFVSPIPINFGAVPYGGSGSQNVTITNTTIAPFNWEVDPGNCEGHIFTFVPDNGTLAPGASTICVVTWTPSSIEEILQCSFLFGFCDKPEIRVEVEGYSVQDCSCLCCNNVTIGTENGLLRDIDALCGTNRLVTSTIADKKTMKFEFTYQNGISDGVKFWFNPILFAFVCDFSGVTAPPSVAWFIEYDNTMTDGVAVPMTLIGAGSNSLNQMNFNVQFVPISAASGEFQILFDFFLVSDFENLINATTFSNNIKFKRNVATSLTDWANTLPSVYNANKRLCSMIYLRDPNVLVDDAPFECIETSSIRFSARWFNLGLYNGASEFNSPSFQFYRNTLVNNFSTIQQTQVVFNITIPSIYGGASGIILQLFDETQFDNSVDFLTNYNSSRAQILNVGVSGVIDNNFNSPSEFNYLGGDVWQVACYVDTLINPSSTYRIAAVVYANDTITANTFLSEPISVTEQPDPNCDCSPQVRSTFEQVFQSQESNCLRPAPKERIQHRLSLDSGGFKDCLDKWGALIPGVDWRNFLTRITLTIYKRANAFPTATQTTFFVYSQHVSNRVAGFPGGWQNLNDLIVQDSGGGVIESTYLTRVRWEQLPFSGQVLVAPTAQYMNRTSAGPLSSTYITSNSVVQSWVEEDVFFEYTFQFDLSSLFGPGNLWNIIDAFRVNAIDFEPDNSGFPPIIEEVKIEGYSITSETWQTIDGTFCPADFSSIRVYYYSNEDGDFVFFLEKSPFGLPYIEESEVNSSPFGIPLLSIPGVTYQDAVFSLGQAMIEFDPSIFTGLNEVNICGYISTPPAVLVCEYFQDLACQGGSGLTCNILGGGFMTLTANNASNGRYRQFGIDDGTLGYPAPGSTYVVEYSCSTPPTKAVNFWAGLGQSIRPADFTIPIGATSGTISFVWGGTDTIGRIYAKLGTSATNYTGVITLKFGTAACP
jgi:hypothetical protein